MLLLGVMILVVYGYVRIPYYVAKKSLLLQFNYSYATYNDVFEKRKILLSDTYLKKYYTNSLEQQLQLMKEQKESSRLLVLELGVRNQDGSIPYTAAYELSYENGEIPTQIVHIEGVQFMEQKWLVCWKVMDNIVTHSCSNQAGEEHVH